MRPIVAEAIVEPIDVLPIPTAGRPADYRGAVGKYQIVTEATPSTVKAGDPIKLLHRHRGHRPDGIGPGAAAGRIAGARRADFKVPNEPLAGFVDRTIARCSRRPSARARQASPKSPPFRSATSIRSRASSSPSAASRSPSTSTRPTRSRSTRSSAVAARSRAPPIHRAPGPRTPRIRDLCSRIMRATICWRTNRRRDRFQRRRSRCWCCRPWQL